MRQEPDDRVVDGYGLQGISVEALSIEDYDLPTELPIYNIPVEDRLAMGMQEQLQANDTHFFTRHNDGSVDAQVGNSYEDTLRYADWEVISESGVEKQERKLN